MFPSGATLTFGYLESERDKYRYQSSEVQYVGFDELTQFAESQYLYLFSRLRKLAGAEVPVRMRSASNPGGVGHEWVRSRFVDQEPAQATERIFIPACLSDNPHFDREGYAANLAELDAVTRAQLLEGDWQVRPEGVLFKRDWFAMSRWSGGAPAGRATGTRRRPRVAGHVPPGCSSRGPPRASSCRGRRWPATGRRFSASAHARDRRARRTSGRDLDRAGTGQRRQGERRGLVRNLAGFMVRADRVTGDKVSRARPLAAQCEAGNVRLLRGPGTRPTWRSSAPSRWAATPTASMPQWGLQQAERGARLRLDGRGDHGLGA